MRLRFSAVCALALLGALSFFRSASAQTSETAVKSRGPFAYDASQEVRISGTVSAVFAKQFSVMPGAHLLLSTLNGSLDVSLGTLALRGKEPLSVMPGQQVEVTGVMKVWKEKSFLLARSVKAGDRVFEIRNEYGGPITPQARERSSQASHNQETR